MLCWAHAAGKGSGSVSRLRVQTSSRPRSKLTVRHDLPVPAGGGVDVEDGSGVDSGVAEGAGGVLDILGKLLVGPPLVIGQVVVGPLLRLGDFFAADGLRRERKDEFLLPVRADVSPTLVTSLSSLTTSMMSLQPRPSTSANSSRAWSRMCARTVTLPGAGDVISSSGETNERRMRPSPFCAGGPTCRRLDHA